MRHGLSRKVPRETELSPGSIAWEREEKICQRNGKLASPSLAARRTTTRLQELTDYTVRNVKEFDRSAKVRKDESDAAYDAS
jgi:hypothetical protein